MRKNYIWVVEMYFDGKPEPGWYPTVGVAVDAEGIKAELAYWKKQNPDDKLRARKYKAIP